jgi:hypothetical protein
MMRVYAHRLCTGHVFLYNSTLNIAQFQKKYNRSVQMSGLYTKTREMFIFPPNGLALQLEIGSVRIPAIPKEVFRSFPHFLQANVVRVSRLSDDRFLPNPINSFFIYHPTIRIT